ncbi:MAG: nitrate reductase molybdenum cofactor assembly chaperone [Kineosporiaceae bacterium]
MIGLGRRRASSDPSGAGLRPGAPAAGTPARPRSSGELTASDVACVLQAASVLLQYPDADRLALRPVVADAVAGLDARACVPGARALAAFLDAVAGLDDRELAEHYVRVLDRRRRACLYLTWWTDGETRRRGLSLARLKEVYREHGFELDAGGGDGAELPDYLPVMLEFAAAVALDGRAEVGLELLQRHRPGLELLRLALADLDSPYGHVVEAVCAVLPGASPADEAAVRELARTGPPGETVGLDGVPDGVLDPYGALGPTSLAPTFPSASGPGAPAGRRPLPLTVTPPVTSGGRS